MSVLHLVDRERGRLARVIAVGGAAAAVGFAALILALGVMLLGRARWIELPRALPFVVWALVIVGAAALAWATRRVLARDTSVAGLARAVEEEQALRAGSLRGAMEVASTGAFGRRAAETMAERLGVTRTRTLAPRLGRRVLRRTIVGVAAFVVGALLLVERSSAAPDGWRAIAHPVRAWSGTLLPKLSLANAPARVLRGERLALTIDAPDRRSVMVASRARGAAWRTVSLPVRDGRARVTLGPVDADLALYAHDGRSSSDTALVRVVDRPFIGDVSVRAHFPSYLGRAEETLPLGEPARVPQGTVLAIDGQSSTELSDVALVRGAEPVALSVTGRHFSGHLAPTQSGRYAWRATGKAGEIADLPAALEIEVVPDSSPRVEIVAPGRDTTVAASDTVPLSIIASDDHGLASVSLRAWRKTAAGESQPPVSRALATNASLQWSGETAVALSAMGLVPGDEVHVVAVGTDVSPSRQGGQSRELVLRVPGLTEQREAARALADSAVAKAEAAARAEKALAQKTADVSKSRQNRGQDRSQESGASAKGQQSAMSYESAEQAKALTQEQKELADRVQQLQQMAKQLERQLKQAGALDSGLQARLREVQKLLQQALTPELQKQLEKLNAAARNLNRDDARRAMGDLAQQQQKLREQLEKSVEMLKRAALEGSMQTLKDEAKELATKERQLADSLQPPNAQRGQAQPRDRAKDLADRSRALSKDIDELQKRLEQERARSGAERVEQAQQSAKASTEAMQRAARERQATDARQPQNAQQSGAQQQKTAQQQGAERRDGQQGDQTKQLSDARSGQSKAADERGQEQQKAGAKQQGQPKAGGEQQQGHQGQQGQQAQAGRQGGQQGQNGQQSAQGQQKGATQGAQQGATQGAQQGGDKLADAAREAADAMDRTASELADAREKQIGEWKKELTSELDQSIQEMLQLARQQDALEQQARQGSEKSTMLAQQSALQQGVGKAAERLGDAGQKSSLLSQHSQRSVGDARKKVEQATQELAQAGSPQQAASAMRDASDALNQAAASLVRDRERATNAQSASGFAEMLEQLQQMAKQQGALNAQAMELLPKPGAQLDQNGREVARRLAQQQKDVASRLDDVGDMDRTGKADELAKEARQLAQAMEQGQLDPSVLERQQRLFRRMLDAGRTLEQDERDDQGKREARAWTGSEVFAPEGAVNTKAASKFQAPSWADLRGLSPEERRMVLEYFKRINGERPQ